MTYLDLLASQIEARIPQDLLPAENVRPLLRLYAVLALAKGPAVEAIDVHNAWAAWMQEQNPEHHSIKPFGELNAATQASDEPFAQAIREVAKQINDH